MASPVVQRHVVDGLYGLMAAEGFGFHIELSDGYARINDDGEILGLAILPIQQHLKLLTWAFDDTVCKRLTLVEAAAPSSTTTEP